MNIKFREKFRSTYPVFENKSQDSCSHLKQQKDGKEDGVLKRKRKWLIGLNSLLFKAQLNKIAEQRFLKVETLLLKYSGDLKSGFLRDWISITSQTQPLRDRHSS